MKTNRKLRILISVYEGTKSKYTEAMEAIKTEIENITGKSVYYNDFADDGLAISISDDNIPSYMSISEALKWIEETGTIPDDAPTSL